MIRSCTQETNHVSRPIVFPVYTFNSLQYASTRRQRRNPSSVSEHSVAAWNSLTDYIQFDLVWFDSFDVRVSSMTAK